MKQYMHVDGLAVDPITGEIIGIDDKPSVLTERIEYQQPLSACRSINDYDDHLDDVDLRTLPPRNKALLDTMQAEADWIWKHSNKAVDCRITSPVMKILKVLEKVIRYRNILVTTQVNLAKLLSVSTDDIMRKLKPLSDKGLIRIRTSKDGMRKGEVAICVNPRFLFRGDDWVKKHYVTEWYKPKTYVNELMKPNPVPKLWLSNKKTHEAYPPCVIEFLYTSEQFELRRQGRYVEYGESVRIMRLDKMPAKEALHTPLAA